MIQNGLEGFRRIENGSESFRIPKCFGKREMLEGSFQTENKFGILFTETKTDAIIALYVRKQDRSETFLESAKHVYKNFIYKYAGWSPQVSRVESAAKKWYDIYTRDSETNSFKRFDSVWQSTHSNKHPI